MATGAGIYLRHTWGESIINAYYSTPAYNQTAYAWTYVYSPKAQTVGAQIEFQNYSRSEQDPAPAAGQWDVMGSRIWINNVEVPAPNYQNTGVSINNKWRQIRSDAAEKFVRKNKSLAKKIFRLPASSGEKQRLYGILNSSVEASSNLSLAKYRLKTKEYKNGKEKRALRKDVQTTKRLINQNTKDINWVIKKIKHRA